MFGGYSLQGGSFKEAFLEWCKQIEVLIFVDDSRKKKSSRSSVGGGYGC